MLRLDRNTANGTAAVHERPVDRPAERSSEGHVVLARGARFESAVESAAVCSLDAIDIPNLPLAPSVGEIEADAPAPNVGQASATPPALPVVGWIARVCWILLGFGLLGMGVIGILVPGWPTTIFVILATASFARGEPRLARWLEQHRVFGRFIAMARNGMPMRAKVISIAAMWAAVGSSAAWMLFIREQPLLVPAIVTLAMGVAGAVVVMRVRGPARA